MGGVKSAGARNREPFNLIRATALVAPVAPVLLTGKYRQPPKVWTPLARWCWGGEHAYAGVVETETPPLGTGCVSIAAQEGH